MGQLQTEREVAFVYGTRAGVGGLGVQSANAIAGLMVGGAKVHAFGPGHINGWPLPEDCVNLRWHESPQFISPWMTRYTRLRWNHGDLQYKQDCQLGHWAKTGIEKLHPNHCYVFTQVGLETLKWAKQAGVPTVLETPNGHIRNFRQVNEIEVQRWYGVKYKGHPSPAMVERVEEEYQLADRIRVSSEWTKATLIARGVLKSKIQVLQQPVDLKRYHPPAVRLQQDGPLRLCFVGSLDFRKGFVYLLRAMRLIGPSRVSLEIVGATGDRYCAKLLAREGAGLNIKYAPGNPVSAYHQAELFVLPTLEDGSPFAVAEAMACGLPVIVTDSCGSAEWVRSGQSGWVVRAAHPEALAAAMEDALNRRRDLISMGLLARQDVEHRAGASCFSNISEWAYRQN